VPYCHSYPAKKRYALCAMRYVILGIDPGIADTGYGVIRKEEGDKISCLDYGSITTSSKMQLPARLKLLYEQLLKLIKNHKPEIIAVEQLFFCKNVKTALVVGHARGVVLLVAEQCGLPVFEFTPLQVKQAVSSYGQADKTQVQKMVKLLLNLKNIPKPDDAADALAVAICGANSRQTSSNT